MDRSKVPEDTGHFGLLSDKDSSSYVEVDAAVDRVLHVESQFTIKISVYGLLRLYLWFKKKILFI